MCQSALKVYSSNEYENPSAVFLAPFNFHLLNWKLLKTFSSFFNPIDLHTINNDSSSSEDEIINIDDLVDSYSDDGFMKEVQRLRETYPEEKRHGLLQLVAFYLHQRDKYLFFFGTSESEQEDRE